MQSGEILKICPNFQGPTGGSMHIIDNDNNNTGIIQELLLEAEDIPENEFERWYEKKRKLFNIGIKKTPTKTEFIKYLNYASAILAESK